MSRRGPFVGAVLPDGSRAHGDIPGLAASVLDRVSGGHQDLSCGLASGPVRTLLAHCRPVPSGDDSKPRGRSRQRRGAPRPWAANHTRARAAGGRVQVWGARPPRHACQRRARRSRQGRRGDLWARVWARPAQGLGKGLGKGSRPQSPRPCSPGGASSTCRARRSGWRRQGASGCASCRGIQPQPVLDHFSVALPERQAVPGDPQQALQEDRHG